MPTPKLYKFGKQKTQQLLKIDFIRFGIVGAVGFLVTLILKVTVFSKLSTYPALFLSSEGGMLSNFVFHEKWTYNHVDHHDKPLLKKFIHFQMSSLSGVVLVTITSGIAINTFGLPIIVGLAIGAAITMFWNYFWTKYYIFKGKTPAVLLKPEDTVPEK